MKNILKDFLYILNKTVNDVENTRITDVIDKINECSPEILKEKKCPKCSKGSLTIKFIYTEGHL